MSQSSNAGAYNLCQPVQSSFSDDDSPVLAHEIRAQQEAEHRCELWRLQNLARIFLSFADGDPAAATEMLEDSISLLFDSGVLSMWHYRTVLSAIKKGM